MTDEQANRLVEAIGSHADQQGGNLVHLKRFLAKQQEDQQAFLAEQRAASEASQKAANKAARWSAIAAAIVAVAAMVQAYVAITERSTSQPLIEMEQELSPTHNGELPSG